MDIPELAGRVENNIIQVLADAEEILDLGEPQTSEAGDTFYDLSDFVLLVSRGYNRVKSSLNELQG